MLISNAFAAAGEAGMRFYGCYIDTARFDFNNFLLFPHSSANQKNEGTYGDGGRIESR